MSRSAGAQKGRVLVLGKVLMFLGGDGLLVDRNSLLDKEIILIDQKAIMAAKAIIVLLAVLFAAQSFRL